MSKAGAAQFPLLVPTSEDATGADVMRSISEELSRWQKPALIAFSGSGPHLPVSEGGPVFAISIPMAGEQVKIEGASHFLQEDRGERLAQEVLEHLG